MGKIGPKFSHLLTVRAEGADPPLRSACPCMLFLAQNFVPGCSFSPEKYIWVKFLKMDIFPKYCHFFCFTKYSKALRTGSPTKHQSNQNTTKTGWHQYEDFLVTEKELGMGYFWRVFMANIALSQRKSRNKMWQLKDQKDWQNKWLLSELGERCQVTQPRIRMILICWRRNYFSPLF